MNQDSRGFRTLHLFASFTVMSALFLWAGISEHSHFTIWVSGGCGGLALLMGLAEGIGIIIGRKMMLHSEPREPGE